MDSGAGLAFMRATIKILDGGAISMMKYLEPYGKVWIVGLYLSIVGQYLGWNGVLCKGETPAEDPWKL